MDKATLRILAKECRVSRHPTADQDLAARALSRLSFPQTVAGVWPLPDELDLRPLLRALHARGHRIVLPLTPPRGQALSFRLWQPDAPMAPGRFGTCHPEGDMLVPDLLLVPMLAFDRAGNRLGYGGGYYDRTLAALPGRAAIGFAYAAQEVASVPAEPHDCKVDMILTELELITVNRDPYL